MCSFVNIYLSFFDKYILTFAFSGAILTIERNDFMKKSVYLSIAATCTLFIVLIVLTFKLPAILENMSQSREVREASHLLLPLYISALPGFLCLLSLLKLLINLTKDKLFVKENVVLLSVLSYSCIFVGVEYFIFRKGFISMTLISFAALFFGLILTVIKNVFQKAIILREENDFTI